MNMFRVALAAAALTFTSATVALAQAPTAAAAPPTTTNSGPLKIGYTSVEYVLSQMPESKQIESDLKAFSTQLENQLKSKYQEYQTKAEAYQKGASTMTDVVRADKEKELTNMQQSIQEFQRSADQSLLNSDGASPVLLHGPKDGDISDLVLRKMGITPGAAPTAPKAAAPATPTTTPVVGNTKTKTKSKK
jgi:outer membrane protein